MDKKRRNKISFVTTLFGLIANALLCAGKFAVGLLCGNIAVTADAVNNLSDAGNNVVTLIAIKVAGKPADKEHPFGHERVEYVSALVVAFIILFLGVELAVSSVEKIILNFKEPYLPEFDAWLVYVLSFSVVVKVVMFFVYRTNGKKAQSPVLKAMALDSIMDVAATAAVLAAILIGRLASVNLDGYMGLAVSVLIFVGGIKIAKDTVSGLRPTKSSLPSWKPKSRLTTAYSASTTFWCTATDLTIHSSLCTPRWTQKPICLPRTSG